MVGQSVQAGTIYGGVHYHVSPPPPQPYVTPYVPVHRRSQVWPVVGRWFIALLPLILCTATVGGAVDGAAAGAHIAVRVLLDLIVLAFGVPLLIVWSAVSGRGFGPLLQLVLEKVTPAPLAESSARVLWAVTAGAGFVGLFGFVREALEADQQSPGANGALLFFAMLTALAGRRLVVRHRR
ncbi:hypothetical protein BBK82_27125 [Lentzea guizhouensis]|uniref:Uncharacterized protein n=1 Tax=Lentzea guizhouensis TaxID=1586287 RepID=A0A1B2HNA2_9PSEU|nr:hypothetical protein BBK82_27125 [Lentzea guizhouensis]